VIPSVVVIGLDCLEPSLVFDRYRDALPAFRSLAEQGAWGTLRSTDPPVTVPAWTCMFSGCSPEEQGLYGFRHRKLGSVRGAYSVNSTHVRRPRVWDLVAAKGFTSALVGVPQTWPAASMNGYVIADTLTAGEGARAWPDGVLGEVEQAVGPWIGDVEGFRTGPETEVLAAIHGMTRQRFEAFRYLLARRPADLMVMVDLGPDRLHHRFFHRIGTGDDVVRDYYRLLDQELGRALSVIPDDAHVLVVSDHGARPLRGAFCINDWLIEKGWLVLRQPPRAERPFDESLVDWSRTRAWAWGGHHGRVFVNLKGREPAGLVNPDEYERFLDEITSELGSGHRVLRLHGEGDYPDLIVYAGDLDLRCIGSVGHGEVIVAGNDTGDDRANHAMEGVLLYRGPALSGRVHGMRGIDVAGLVMGWFGERR